ncbi:AIR synthase-related protein, partial [uncultured Desulfovibrio sp.]
LGARVDLDAVPALEAMSRTELLYSESASRLLVSVAPQHAALMDALGEWQLCRRIGEVTDGPALELCSGSSTLAAVPVEELATAFKVTLDW